MTGPAAFLSAVDLAPNPPPEYYFIFINDLKIAFEPAIQRKLRAQRNTALENFLSGTFSIAEMISPDELQGVRRITGPVSMRTANRLSIGFTQEAWASLCVSFVTGIRSRQVRTDCGAVWTAVATDGDIPAAILLTAPRTLVVWRQGLSPRFRMLGAEASDLEALQQGGRFGDTCETMVKPSVHPASRRPDARSAFGLHRVWFAGPKPQHNKIDDIA